MIIDVRFRPPYKGFLNLHVFSENPARRPGLKPKGRTQSFVDKTVASALEEMERAGITKALVIGRHAGPPFCNVPNEDVLSFSREYRGRFFAVPAIDATDREVAIDGLEQLLSQPEVKAIHLEPGWAARPMYVDDTNLYPIYERLANRGMPALISAGGTIGPDYSYTDPVHVHRVAKDFPKLKIVLAHAGWPYVMQAIAVAYDCENVCLSPDMYLNIPDMPGVHEYVRAANVFMPDRLIFGTAYPAAPFEESVECFNRLPFEDGIKEKVLYHNAARVFGI